MDPKAAPEETDNVRFKIDSVKKDALYKPLLRKFRAFLRKLFDAMGLAKGCHRWSSEKKRGQVWKFMHVLEFPEIFMDLKSLSIMIILLFPVMGKKRKKNKQYCRELAYFFKEIKLSCHDVFQENN